MLENSILTVVKQAAQQDLITLQVLKDDLDIKDGKNDKVLERCITRASIFAAAYCRRTFNGRSAMITETVKELFRSEGFISPFFFGHSPAAFVSDHPAQHKMILRRRPVQSIVSILEDDVALDPTQDYELDGEKAWLTRLVSDRPWPWYFLKLEVTYIAGFDPTAIPMDLQQAVIMIARELFFERKRDPRVKQENVFGVADVSYWIGALGDGMPEDIALALAPYVEPIV